MLADLKNVIARLTDIGLGINGGKCELTILDHASLDDCQLTEAIFKAVLPDIKIVLINECTLLGVLISPRPFAQSYYREARRLDPYGRLSGAN